MFQLRVYSSGFRTLYKDAGVPDLVLETFTPKGPVHQYLSHQGKRCLEKVIKFPHRTLGNLNNGFPSESRHYPTTFDISQIQKHRLLIFHSTKILYTLLPRQNTPIPSLLYKGK